MDELTLVGTDPKKILPHGPSKLFVDDYLWFSSKLGAIGSYRPTDADVHDHFEIFRGVDQLESFGQLAIVSICTILECEKQRCSFTEFKMKFSVLFLAVGQVHFHDIIKSGERFISIGKIKRFKFRQIEVDGWLYRVPKGFELESFFSEFSEKDFEENNFPKNFELVAELTGGVGRAVKKTKIR